ncbi:MAG: 30S ribosomal protein S20 [Gammaproteobacteria bacterium]|nr:30S ribosomal protein S20 [Gammaproteobacteria bacterium]
MANSPQAKKRARQAETHRKRNASQKSAMRTSVKMVAAAIDTADYDAAQAAFQKAMPVIDSAVSKGLIHRNKAARTKSHLNTRIKSLK